MRKFYAIVMLLAGLIAHSSAQAPGANNDTIVRSGPVKSWPAGPYSQISTNYGLMTTSIPLIGLKGKGLTALNLSLIHRSVTIGNDLGIFTAGRGWSHSGVNYLFRNNGVTRAIANRATDFWTYNVGTGIFDRKPGVRDDLTQITGGYKVVDYTTKMQYFYDREVVSNYLDLTKVVDPFGNQITYSYIGSSRNLYRITDASGRYIEFTYEVVNGFTRLKTIHLQAGLYLREWDLSYGSKTIGGITYWHYLEDIIFPSPDASTSRPSIAFDNDDAGQITYLRTLSGKLWGFGYGHNLYGQGYTGVTEVYPPLKATPTSGVDTVHYTSLGYGLSGGTGTSGRTWCDITDPMGNVHTHIYWAYSAQNTTDFPYPIKEVYDPTTTRYSDPRNNQTPINWTWYEQYHWNTSSATCDTFTDKNGIATSFAYDSNNRGLVATKSVVNQGVTHTDSYSYTTDGLLSQHTDAYGTVTTNTYDSTTRALTQTALDPSGENITKNYHYNGSGDVDEEWTGSDPHTYFGNFDSYGNPQSIDPPTALASTFTYDDFNNRLTSTEPSPKGTTTFTYDWWNRQLRTTFPDAKYVETAYDLEGNVVDVRMEDGSHRSTTYNFLNLAATQTVPVDGVSANNLVTSTDYDYNGRRISITAPDGIQTTFLYNERGNLIKTTYSDGTNRQWGYDGNGNVLWRQNGRGNLTYYGYDDISRLLTVDYQSSGTPDVTFAYRKDGLRTSRTDTMGTSTWTYNNAKQLTGQYDAATNKSLTFAYQTGTGRLTSLGAPGNTWSYYYDTSTRPWYTTQSISGEIARNAVFGDDGSVIRRTSPNNTKTEYSYDSRGRVTNIRHAVDSLNYDQETLSYTYTNGNLSQYTLTINGGAAYTTNYTHDYANRLLSEVRTDSSGLNGYNNSYVYTKGNDRGSTTRNGSTSIYTYFAGANRFKTGEGYTVNSYDNDGNPTSITVPGSVTWTLAYDEESRLTQIAKTGGNVSFKYDGDGQRVERATPTSTYRYLVNGGNVVLTTTTSYSIQAYYTPRVGYFSGGKMRFYQENALGSALVVRDDAGNWESLTEYDAFGKEYDINGTQKSDFRFAGAHGYVTDDTTGMDLLGARYYLPILGRFLNQDPIGLSGGLNLYGYCENNPLTKVDPDGKQGVDLDSVRASISAAMRKATTNPAEALRDLRDMLTLSGMTAKTVEMIQRRINDVQSKISLMHTHHYLPKQYEKFFSDPKRNMDIEDYCMRINAEIHRISHGKFVQGFAFPGMQGEEKFKWNEQWAIWIENNRNATPQQVVNFANELAKNCGLPQLFLKQK